MRNFLKIMTYHNILKKILKRMSNEILSHYFELLFIILTKVSHF